MREILFRGKRTDTGEWVEGYYLNRSNDEEDIHCIMEKYPATVGKRVIPETVGQYTGLTDKNGNRIFEGSIVRTHMHNGKYYEEVIGVITWIKDYMGFAIYDSRKLEISRIDAAHHQLEIIGNIVNDRKLSKRLGKRDYTAYNTPIENDATRIEGEWSLSNVACEPRCSNCGEFALELGLEKVRSVYCPHCGAKMKNPEGE